MKKKRKTQKETKGVSNPGNMIFGEGPRLYTSNLIKEKSNKILKDVGEHIKSVIN